MFPIPREALANTLEMRCLSRTVENLDNLFSGSWSTLLTTRQAILMKLDPLYCDVIIQWSDQFTGMKSVRASHSTEIDYTGSFF